MKTGQIVKVRFQDMSQARMWKWVNAEVLSATIPVGSVVVRANINGRNVVRRVHPADLKEKKCSLKNIFQRHSK